MELERKTKRIPEMEEAILKERREVEQYAR